MWNVVIGIYIRYNYGGDYMKILHTGDLHLGRFYKGELPQNISSIRREELWVSFKNTIEYVNDNNIDVLLICGDIYEREYFTFSDMLRFRDILNKLNSAYTFIIGGNHDYIDENSLLYKVDFNEKVYIFNKDAFFDIDELNLRVHGISWNRQFDFNTDLNFKVEDEKTNILMLHGSVGGRDYFPIDMKVIDEYKFDYVALGHIHLEQKIEDNCYYCGSPEGLSFSELGDRGFLVVEIENGERKVDFISNSIRKYNEIILEVSEDITVEKVLEEFNNLLSSKKEDLNRVIVRGKYTNPNYLIEVLKNQRGFFYVEIVDELKLTISIEELYEKNRENIIGKYIAGAKADTRLLNIGLKALLEAKNEN